MSRVSLVRSVVLALTVATFVGGAALIGVRAGDATAQAEELLRSFYERRQAGPLIERLVEGSLGPDVDPQQLEVGIGRLLEEPFEVEDTDRVEVRGTTLARVTVARPQGPPLDWCVLPDGGVLLGCRVATADVDGTAEGAPIAVQFAAIDLQPDAVQLALVLATESQEPVPIEGDLTVDDLPFELSNTAYLAGGQQVPADPNDLAVQPGAGLLLIWDAQDVDDLSRFVGDALTVSWDGGSVRLELGEVTWFVPAAASGATS